jgi:urease accessory protein
MSASLEPGQSSVLLNIKPTFPTSLLLLSDSALPLGSFAFSSGLESYLAHRSTATSKSPAASISQHLSPFLTLSIASIASTSIPYILSVYRSPDKLVSLDNDFDASTPCTVARRASIAQGRALLGVWEKAFRDRPDHVLNLEVGEDRQGRSKMRELAEKELLAFSSFLKSSTSPSAAASLQANGHFAPLWGVVCLTQNLSLEDTAYLFLFNHARAVISAAVRAGVLGPYQAQGVLASGWLKEKILKGMMKCWALEVEEAGQCVPVLDLWVGRHECLYSRIFNS